MTDSLQFPVETGFDSSITADVAEAAPQAAALPNAFAALGLAPELVQAVADLGFTQPTLVQNATIPKAMNGGHSEGFTDLMVSSQTGSGKTAAFLLPVLHTLLEQQAAAEAAERADWDRQVAEDRFRVRQTCEQCRGGFWVVGPDGAPVEPARPCPVCKAARSHNV